jgi:flagellar M-ring protein FliF
MNIARLREGWSSLETRNQLTLVGAVLAVLVTFYFLYSMSGKQSYTTLATGLDPAQTGDWEKTLSSSGIAYKVGTGGTELDVPASQVSAARVALAEKGMLSSSQSAFSSFNKTSLGTTDFQQQVQYQQALQAEIASTIEQIQGVNSATVALVLPTDTLFADEQSKASASVLVNGGGTLDSSTVAGIAHLVSSSVKGLDAQNVTITDDTGALLWPTSTSGGGAGNADSKLQADNLYGSQLASQVNALLTSTLGPNKALAQVHADLDVDQTTLDKVTYAKKGVPLNAQTQTETLTSKGGGAQLPAGASTNTTTLPSYAGTTSGTNSQSQYKNQTSTTSYGVDKTISHSVVAPGTVNKLSVALMVDSSVPQAQVASLQKSVSSLVGLTPSRGDTIAVTRLAFAKQPTAATASSGPLAMLGNPLGMAKDVLVGLAALIFLFMMRRALKRREGESSVPTPTWLRELEAGQTVAELEAGGPPVPALPAGVIERRNAVREQVEEIAENSPEAIASQVAAWMKE